MYPPHPSTLAFPPEETTQAVTSPRPRVLDAQLLHGSAVWPKAKDLRSWAMAAGAALGVATVLFITKLTSGAPGAPSLVASMGASAVILYAMPDTPAARIRTLFGGHLISASVGILTASYVAHPIAAVAFAVGGSLLLMSLFRCIHPPGGATALTVVLGGHEIRELGFSFLINPLLSNLLILGVVTWMLRLPQARRSAKTP